MTTSGGKGSVFAPIVESPEERAAEHVKIQRSRSSVNAQLVSWLLSWPKPSITKRDIQAYAPNWARDPAEIPTLAQTLVECGWLLPARAHRRDMKKWRIIREPTVRV
jgi:hypothetical protein